MLCPSEEVKTASLASFSLQTSFSLYKVVVKGLLSLWTCQPNINQKEVPSWMRAIKIQHENCEGTLWYSCYYLNLFFFHIMQYFIALKWHFQKTTDDVLLIFPQI